MTKAEKRIPELKDELAGLGPILPGSISKQWNVCGTPGCKCEDPEHPITERRVGTLKNSFLERPMRGKGFEPGQLNVAWAVLTHNLWVIARLPKADDAALRLKSAA